MHGIIVVVNRLSCRSCQVYAPGLKQPIGCGAAAGSNRIGADTLLLLTVADAGNPEVELILRRYALTSSGRIKSLERLAGHERRMAHDFHRALHRAILPARTRIAERFPEFKYRERRCMPLWVPDGGRP
ncbi:hypothetical protein [Duncaniella dubosii]|uniref:hypothetical protein n=1 Tax=Duncaniella dubosii TaxID=2518971 RepID=UPI003F671BCB